MNSDNDRTAIWLEQKFDVPGSGQWRTENVFAISAALNEPSTPTTGFPGLIIFECTPLEEVDDELERYVRYFADGSRLISKFRKYRILDDLSRLRDIIALLNADDHYEPSFLFINWDSKGVSTDILDVVGF